jgi:hypothetical protein
MFEWLRKTGESGDQELGIGNLESGIWNRELGIRNLESGIWISRNQKIPLHSSADCQSAPKGNSRISKTAGIGNQQESESAGIRISRNQNQQESESAGIRN